jgi:dTDP-4-dehydrorhamnose reductase
MINNIIIFGTNGMLGRYIYKYFTNKNEYNITSIMRDEYTVDSDNFNQLEQLLLSKNINENTCVINCIGIIPQRFVGKEDYYYIINSIFPQYLSKICSKYGTKLIQPTTDCVFNGSKGKYIETDFHDETNNYGISKSLGENIDATIIRSSIIGEEIYNKKSFIEWVKNSNGTINGWTNHLWNGITCLEYCKVVEQIIKENLFWKGVRHILSPTEKSKYELANIIKDVYNLDIIINPKGDKTYCNKTLSTIYDTNNIFNIIELEEQIIQLKEFKL